MRWLLVAVVFVLAQSASGAEDQDRPMLGLMVFDAAKRASELKKTMGLTTPQSGAWVASVVDGGPADRAGIEKLDVIIKVGDKAVKDRDTFTAAVNALEVGAVVELRVRRPREERGRLKWETTTIEVTPIHAAEMKKIAAEAEKKRAEAPPLSFQGSLLRTNVIGLPEVWVNLKNESPADLVAVEVEIECYNRFDEKVTDLRGSHVFRGIAQQTVKPDRQGSFSWQLSLHSTTAKTVIRVVRAKLEDGTDWRAKPGKAPTTKAQLAD